MLRRSLAAALALLLCGVALAEGPYCVVEGGVVALVDADGTERISANAWEDLFAVVPGRLYAAGEPGSYALVDAGGNIVFGGPCGMYYADGDVVLMRQGQYYGALDANGGVLIDPEWTQLACDGRGGFFAVSGSAVDENADELCHIGPDGEAVGTGVMALGLLRRVSDDRMAVCGSDGMWGYVDGGGKQVIPGEWLSAGDFADSRAIVTGPLGCGVIDPDGEPVIRAEYECVLRCGNRFATLDGEGNLDLCDAESGRPIAKLEGTVTSIMPLGEAMAVSGGGGTALIDGEGRTIARLSAEGTFAAGDGGQYIAADGPWGEANSWILNADGTAASGRYQRLLALCAGRYAFATMSGAEYYSEKLGDTQKAWDYNSLRYGLLDVAGGELLPAEYRRIRALDDERLLLVTDDTVTLADRGGRPIRTWPLRAGEEASDETGE